MAPLTKPQLREFLVSVTADGDLLVSFLGGLINSIPVVPDAPDVLIIPGYDTVASSAQRVGITGPASLGVREFVAHSDHGHQVSDNIIDGSFLGSLLLSYDTVVGSAQRVGTTGPVGLGTRPHTARSDHGHQVADNIIDGSFLGRRLPPDPTGEGATYQHLSVSSVGQYYISDVPWEDNANRIRNVGVIAPGAPLGNTETIPRGNHQHTLANNIYASHGTTTVVGTAAGIVGVNDTLAHSDHGHGLNANVIGRLPPSALNSTYEILVTSGMHTF